MSNCLCRRLFVLIIGISFLVGACPGRVFAQSRRQPPVSDQKKNKRPPEGGQQPEEKKEEPLPPDLTGKPQEAEKVSVTTNVVNVNALGYNKKTGQPTL